MIPQMAGSDQFDPTFGEWQCLQLFMWDRGTESGQAWDLWLVLAAGSFLK
jgi:hypothetical protein